MFVYQPTLERQFSEPHAWWDEYDARREEQYRELIKGKTCVDDCGKCRIPDIHDSRFHFMTVGFCPEIDDFVGEGDTPARFDCQSFAGAA